MMYYQVIFSDADALSSMINTEGEFEDGSETESPTPEEFYDMEEIFSNVVDTPDAKVESESEFELVTFSS